MQLQVLDIDGSVTLQKQLMADYRTSIIPLREWGPNLRLACSFRRFRRFEGALERLIPAVNYEQPTARFLGSGDFHHVSLALVRRLSVPINLLVIDNHPDWMRGVPFLHCGTWLYHAARLPHVERVFHVGGNVDFDNYYQCMAPWPLLTAEKIRVFPGVRRFSRGRWKTIPNEPIRGPTTPQGDEPAEKRVRRLLDPIRSQIAARPLYVSLDKDVMPAAHAVVNWDSGHLGRGLVRVILTSFLEAAGGRLAGMDIVGDWSPVRVRGALRRLMHIAMHPPMEIDEEEATLINQETNLMILECVERSLRMQGKHAASITAMMRS